MKTQVGKVIAPDGTETTIRPANGKKFELAELQKAVGGYIELVYLKPGNGRGTAYVNEEGKLHPGFPRNDKATGMLRLFSDDFVSGNLLIVSREEKPQ